jgi:hypothetical protein
LKTIGFNLTKNNEKGRLHIMEKVTKSFSLDKEIVEKIEIESEKEKLKPSTFLNRFLHKTLLVKEVEVEVEVKKKK